MIIIKVRKKLGLLKFYWRKLGTRGLLRHLYFRYLKKSITDLSTQNLGKIDVVSFYDFVRHQPFGEPLDRDRCDRKSVSYSQSRFDLLANIINGLIQPTNPTNFISSV